MLPPLALTSASRPGPEGKEVFHRGHLGQLKKVPRDQLEVNFIAMLLDVNAQPAIQGKCDERLASGVRDVEMNRRMERLSISSVREVDVFNPEARIPAHQDAHATCGLLAISVDLPDMDHSEDVLAPVLASRLKSRAVGTESLRGVDDGLGLPLGSLGAQSRPFGC